MGGWEFVKLSFLILFFFSGDGPDEPNGCNDLDCGGSLGSPHSHKSKRSRTTFSEDQLKVSIITLGVPETQEYKLSWVEKVENIET